MSGRLYEPVINIPDAILSLGSAGLGKQPGNSYDFTVTIIRNGEALKGGLTTSGRQLKVDEEKEKWIREQRTEMKEKKDKRIRGQSRSGLRPWRRLGRN